MKVTTVILIILLFDSGSNINSTFNYSQNDWILKKDANNIKIYTRISKESNIKEFKAITTVKTPVSNLVAVLNDVESYPLWMSDVKTVKTLKQVNNKERYDYYEASLPWPFKNRDIVLHHLLTEDFNTGVVEISLTGKPDYISQKSGIVRVLSENGIWRFTPKENGATEILYQVFANPGGELPVWLINMFVVEGPYSTLNKLKGFARKGKYYK